MRPSSLGLIWHIGDINSRVYTHVCTCTDLYAYICMCTTPVHTAICQAPGCGSIVETHSLVAWLVMLRTSLQLLSPTTLRRCRQRSSHLLNGWLRAHARRQRDEVGQLWGVLGLDVGAIRGIRSGLTKKSTELPKRGTGAVWKPHGALRNTSLPKQPLI